MKLTILGSGTSSGVPQMGCQCEVCQSNDPHDKRLRCASLIETDTTRVLIDSGPDIRQQLMPFDFKPLDGILITHIHYDHVGGIDDLRGFCQFGDLHIYANNQTAEGLKQTMPYCFGEKLYPGVPLLKLHTIAPHQQFNIGNIAITPIEVMHGQMPILGYVFNEIVGDNKADSKENAPQLVYITDMKTIADEELSFLYDTDTLIINALRFGHNHHSHQNAEEACEFAAKIRAKRAFIVHLSHGIGLHKNSKKLLPDNISLAYDRQTIDL